MDYDFDRAAERLGTASFKWDALGERFGNAEALPFWVADSDYFTAPEVMAELEKQARGGSFGYTFPDEAYLDSVCAWFERRHGWRIERDWIVPSTGIVSGLANIIRCFTEPGDGIIVQPPVYDPFYETVERSGRRVLRNWLLGDNVSGYTMDFDDMEQKLAAGAKLLILCSPHNPVGRVWTKEELARAARLCAQYGAIAVSDEIHWDLLIGGAQHTCFGAAAQQKDIVVLSAPSKTFNLAGLQTSNLIFPDEGMRKKYKAWLAERFIEAPNKLGMAACRAAYEHGDGWCDAQNAYLTENARLVERFVADRLPGVTMAKLEGTYLIWLDMRVCGLTSKELVEKLAAAGAALNDGFRYGGERYDGFVRLNIACPRAQLEKGLELMAKALA